METLTIKTPADVLSFISHTLGFWPHESLVCITLDTNHNGVLAWGRRRLYQDSMYSITAVLAAV